MIMPYLNFRGNCEEAFRFYAKVFGSDRLRIARMNNDPSNPVMHASLMLTETGGISGADIDGEGEIKISGMQILVVLPSRERIEELLPRIAEGGSILSGFQPHPPPDDKDGGAAVLDKFGYTWYFST